MRFIRYYKNNICSIVFTSIIALRWVSLGVFVCVFFSISYAIDLGFGLGLEDLLPELKCSINTHSCEMNIDSSLNKNNKHSPKIIISASPTPIKPMQETLFNISGLEHYIDTKKMPQLKARIKALNMNMPTLEVRLKKTSPSDNYQAIARLTPCSMPLMRYKLSLHNDSGEELGIYIDFDVAN